MSLDPPTISSGSSGEIDWPAVSRRLRFLIETNHMSVRDVADELGVRPDVFNDILEGKQRATNSLILSAADFFRVSVDFLTSGQSSHTFRVASPGGSARPVVSRKPSERGSGTLGELAIRHQALVELLIEKGAFSAADYNSWSRKVRERGGR